MRLEITSLSDFGVYKPRRRLVVRAVLAAAACAIVTSGVAGDLDNLAKPHEGRSMRSTSTALDENGDYAHGNSDNSRVAPGATKVVLDAEGPGVITHMWFTFLGPEPHPWAKDGSANHQEILLRIFYDGSERPGVEAPLGGFFANSFGKRSEVVSVPVVVEDADSYNCFWRMPFRKSARVEIVNQSKKKLNLLYYQNTDAKSKESNVAGSHDSISLPAELRFTFRSAMDGMQSVLKRDSCNAGGHSIHFQRSLTDGVNRA